MLAQSKLEDICQEIDARLAREDVRVEDVSTRLRLMQQLEREMESLDALPQLPGTPAGRVATSIWYKLHPDVADIEGMLYLLLDESSLVRFGATEAILATLKAPHRAWIDVRFSHAAKQVVLERRELEPSPVLAHQLDQIAEQIGSIARPRKKPRTKVILNPYVAGLPVYGREKFFGRTEILTQIKNYVQKTEGVKSILLYGARRTGKTSVLYQIRNGAFGSSVLPVYLDMQALAGTELQVFLKQLLLTTLDAVRERQQIHTGDLAQFKDQEITFPVMQSFFHNLLSELKETSLLLMLDEYEVLGGYLTNSNLARQLQSLLELEPKLFAIFAGSQKLEALKEKHKRFLFLLDNAKYVKITFLKRNEALDLITEPSRGKLTFADGVPELILDYTAGHPFYTQLLCQTIFDKVKAGGVVDSEDVEDAVRQFHQDPSPHVILTWNSMDVEQKVVGSTLATLQKDRTASVEPHQIMKRLRAEEYPLKINMGEIQTSLNALKDIDWVERKGEAYRFTMELVRGWIVDNRSIWELAERQREELLSKVAGFGRQRFAWLVDFVAFPIVLLIALAIIGGIFADENFVFVPMFAVPLFYFVVPILTTHSTFGMRLFHLRVVSAKGLALKRKHALLYGLGLALRFFLIGCLIILFLGIFVGLEPESPIVYKVQTLLSLAAVVGEALDLVSILFGQRRQGVYDKLMRTLIVPASAVKE